MSFRNRPVLDRKHRPRWQDELRTQQLIVAGFALAIAAALGIFAATTWFNYYDGHLRPAAAVGDVTFSVDDLQRRRDIIGSELEARYDDLTSQLGGIRDPFIQQAQQAIQQAIGSITSTASDSLVTSRVLEENAGHYGIRVTNAQVSTEVTRRESLAERVKLSLITVLALPSGAKSTDTPTDADWARAKTDIDAIAAQLGAGGDFAAIAKDKSQDVSASNGGLLGWVEAGDTSYDAYFKEAQAGAVGKLIGPTKDAAGYHLLRIEARKAAGPNARLKELLQQVGASDADYRIYILGELMRSAYSDYFDNTVLTQYQPQREVSQILIAKQQGVPVPQERVRHFLAQPVPGAQDQSTATDAQWAAALARAEAFRVAASKPDADWWTLAKTSDDTGSGSKGGDLGWYDHASSQFVPEFKTAVDKLKVGEISQPVKTQFGYHVIEVIAQRITAGAQAQDLVKTLRQDPSQFAKIARDESEDPITAESGGDLGWVIRYQLDTVRSDTIFDLTTPGQISDVLDTDSGFYIFKLVDTSKLRWVPQQQLDTVKQTGLSRWLQEIRDRSHTWVDPQFATAPATG
jgi:parvulin-like peptidyl-prolyl isomerase